MTAYSGHRTLPNGEEWVVLVVGGDGQVEDLPIRLDLVNHSPAGFAWGYAGSGPSQLSLALLAHHLRDDDEAKALYQRFKEAVVVSMSQDDDWLLTQDDIDKGLAIARGSK